MKLIVLVHNTYTQSGTKVKWESEEMAMFRGDHNVMTAHKWPKLMQNLSCILVSHFSHHWTKFHRHKINQWKTSTQWARVEQMSTHTLISVFALSLFLFLALMIFPHCLFLDTDTSQSDVCVCILYVCVRAMNPMIGKTLRISLYFVFSISFKKKWWENWMTDSKRTNYSKVFRGF